MIPVFRNKPIKYSPLLVTIVGLYVLTPLFSKVERPPLLLPGFFLLSVLVILWTLNVRRWLIGIVAGLCIALISGDFLRDGTVDVFEVAIVAVLLWATFILIIRLFQAEKVTMDTISGGIAIYILGAICWAFLFRILYIINPSAFAFGESVRHPTGALYYFSFTTITTLGYGDVTPVSLPALMVANAEALFGQIYIAVLVARLVGMHISQKSVKGGKK